MKVGNLEVYGIIYKITNTINRKVYIGQTIQDCGFKDRYKYNGEGIERVYNHYKWNKEHNYSYNKHLFSSIEKYGFHAFEIDEVFDIAHSQEELNKLEYMYIKIFNLTDFKNGYNNQDGGDNFKKSELSKIKMDFSVARPMICLTTNEVFISPRIFADKYDLKVSSVSSVLLKNGLQNVKLKDGSKLTINYLNGDSKAVIRLDNLDTYVSVSEASKQCEIDRSSISKCCNGKIKSAGKGKIVWKFLIDMYKKNELLKCGDMNGNI